MLLLSVSIAIGYDSFLEINQIYLMEIKLIDLNALAEFTVKFSNDVPFLYGALAILLAISLGALAAFARKILSPVIRKLLSDFRKKEEPKKEEIKFS